MIRFNKDVPFGHNVLKEREKKQTGERAQSEEKTKTVF
jgi:hypothetical protein